MAQRQRRSVGPAADEVLSGLVEIVGGQVDVGLLSGSAHGHVGQLPPATVLVDVGALTGRPLAAVHRGGIPVGQLRWPRSPRARRRCPRPSSIWATRRWASRSTRKHHAALGGHDLAVCPRGEGHDPVAGRVAGPAGSRRARARSPSLGCHLSRARRFSSATLALRQANMAVSLPAPCRPPTLGHLAQGVVAGGAVTTRPCGVELDGPVDVAGASSARASRSAWSCWRTFWSSVWTAPPWRSMSAPRAPPTRRHPAGGRRRPSPPWPRPAGPRRGGRRCRGRRPCPPRRARGRGVGERQPVVSRLPAKRGEGPGLGDARLAAQGARRLAGGRGAEHPEPAGLEGSADRGHDRGLARPGHPLRPARRPGPRW